MKVFLDIRTLRLNLDLSIRDLSTISGVNKTSLWEYENDLSEPTITNYIKIAKAFGINISELENSLLKIH